MKKLYKKILWYIIGKLEYKMDKTEDYEKGRKLYLKMQYLKDIAYDL